MLGFSVLPEQTVAVCCTLASIQTRICKLFLFSFSLPFPFLPLFSFLSFSVTFSFSLSFFSCFVFFFLFFLYVNLTRWFFFVCFFVGFFFFWLNFGNICSSYWIMECFPPKKYYVKGSDMTGECTLNFRSKWEWCSQPLWVCLKHASRVLGLLKGSGWSFTAGSPCWEMCRTYVKVWSRKLPDGCTVCLWIFWCAGGLSTALCVSCPILVFFILARMLQSLEVATKIPCGAFLFLDVH